MKKIKFFISLLKERDYLEEMAKKGWILTNITGGFLYHFKQTEPCEKVFEIERFAAIFLICCIGIGFIIGILAGIFLS